MIWWIIRCQIKQYHIHRKVYEQKKWFITMQYALRYCSLQSVLSETQVSEKPPKKWFTLCYWLFDHHSQKSNWYDAMCLRNGIDRIMYLTSWNIRKQQRQREQNWTMQETRWLFVMRVMFCIIDSLMSVGMHCWVHTVHTVWGAVSIMCRYSKCVHAWLCACIHYCAPQMSDRVSP